ncbi:MAG: SDR family oxidoreductase, partial [Neisseriaceae bacterium]|nr:SDR family oxidoreductase [Neisseriaceae bacterium]
ILSVQGYSEQAEMTGFSKSLAREVGSRGITVNCVAPGFIATDMTDALPDEVKENLIKNIALGKLGVPQNIADAVLFLASDGADYVTGQTLHINGGMLMP